MRRTIHALAAGGVIAVGATMAIAASDLSAGSKALEQVTADMHTSMAVTMTGDVDVDFVRSMIPHHQGAVDMARIVIEHGRDPEIRKLAEDVIAAQETEISFMNAWLERQGVAEPDGEASQDGHMDHSDH